MKTKRLHITKSGDVQTEFVASDALEAYDALAREAIAECRTSITMAARFLSPALWHLPLERQPLARTFSLGGRVLRYDPENVVDRYRADRNELVRDCLHAVLHCTFHHPFDKRHDEFDTWSLACDVAVELCALDLCADRFPCEGDDERLEAAKRLRGEVHSLTAFALYQVLAHGRPGEELYERYGLTGADIAALRDLFTRDAHDLWAGRPHVMPQGEQRVSRAEVPDLQGSGAAEQCEAEQTGVVGEEGAGEGGVSSGEQKDDAAAREEMEASSENGDEPKDSEDAAGEAGAGGEADEAADYDEPQDDDPAFAEAVPEPGDPQDAPDLPMSDEQAEELLEEWRKVSKQVEAELRMQRRRSMSGDGTLLVNLSVANKKAANYDEFLKRFATLAEDLRVSDDEFDYIFYTYGLKRYGNIPLVEPLEYAESNRVREFVIALDTSGSCSGRLIREFVERTYSILRGRTSFGDEINVHLVQCDREVRSATKVTSLRQLEEYRDSFWVSGGGGTDFRPVFAYVDSLVEAGEFRDLRGLIYFTDGFGTFPKRAPDYDVAFVFVDVEGMDVRVPPWAMKVVMTQEEVLEEARGRPEVAIERLQGRGD